MVKKIVQSSPFWMAVAFCGCFTAAFLAVSRFGDQTAQASVSIGDPPANPSDVITPYTAFQYALGSPISGCLNQFGEGHTTDCDPCEGFSPPQNSPGGSNPGCGTGQCGSGGSGSPFGNPQQDYSKSGLDGGITTTPATNRGSLPFGSVSRGGSLIDNHTANYIHIGWDYLGRGSENRWSSLHLTRFFRSRDVAYWGSFGAGGFCNYDIKLAAKLRDKDGVVFSGSYSTDMRVFDPNALIWYSPVGTVEVFDAQGAPMLPDEYGYLHLENSHFVHWTTMRGEFFKFEIVDLGNYSYGAWDARLIRMQDQFGYGTTIQYKQWTPAELAASPERLWQIDQVVGDNGETMTFSYHPQQVGGRWAVSQIAMPNGQNVTYTYTGHRLTSVGHPDGTTTTYTFGGVYADYYNPQNVSLDPGTYYPLVAETVEIVDPTTNATHRHKTAVLTLDNVYFPKAEYVFNQASQLVTSVINESEEVTYLSIGSMARMIYEGQGRLKHISAGLTSPHFIKHYKDGWSMTTAGSFVDSAGNPLGDDDKDLGVVQSFASTASENGVVKTYSHAGQWVSSVTSSDGTTETFQYNSFKQPTRTKDRLGNVTKHTYDAKGNRLTTQVGLLDNGSGGETATPEVATTTYEYYPVGNANQHLLKAVIDPLGNRTDYEYDANHRLSKSISPPDAAGGARAETTYSYNAAGRLSSTIGAGGWGASYTYDVCNRVTKVTHADATTERFIYGTGADAGLLVKVKDRSGVVTKYEYDASGRRIKTIQSYATMDLADAETLITDPALKVEEVVTYVNGTELKATSVRAGEKTTYTYDYRHRLVESKVQPRVGSTLTSKQVYKDNKLFSSEDPYGRKTFYAYRASDASLIRTIQATVPSVTYADFAAVTAATRAAANTPNPTSLITDYTLNNEGRTVATIDPLGTTHTVLYDSRGRTIEQVAASGTAVASKTKTIYDAASRPVEVQSPRYFDATDTTGLNKAKTTMTYSGRGLLLTRTESPGTAEVASESYTYDIEGHQLTRVDARGQTWTNVWSTCCGRQQGAFDPYGHGTIVNVDGLGRATHTAQVSSVTAHAANYKNPIDAQTLGETTTKYDSRGRVTARTVWLTPLGLVDPANPPIYTGPHVNNSASPPAAPYGLTTTYAYDDNLTDSTGLDATFSAHLAGLSLGADSDGSAVLTTNPAGERTLSIKDGLGRGVRSVQLAANNTALVSNTSTFDTVVNIASYGDVLETASANALGHTNKSRTDGAGRTMQSLDATSAITTFVYNANGQRLSVRDPNNVGQDCTYDTLGRDLSCTDTAGAVTSRTYDLAGNVTTQTDAKGKTTTLAYDSRSRRLTTTDRINATTTWTFDAAGNELSMTDAENQTTVYGYDNAGRKITTQWPDHVAGQNPSQPNYGIEAAAYDAANRLLRKTNQLGDTITSTYDLGGRTLSRQYRTLANSPNGTITSTDTFTYDAASRMLTGVKGAYANTVAQSYDTGGRKASESLTIAGQTYTVSTGYDTAGRVSQLTYPDGSVVSRTYDSRRLLSTISLAGTNIDSRTYDASGRLSSETLGNGLVVTRTYMTGDNLPLAISNSAVGTYTYGWDANKNKTGETITGAMSGYTSTMAFDDQNRLTGWNRSSGDSQAWTLSAVNDWQSFTKNGTAEARTHGPAHEVLTVGAAAIQNDSRGNMTSDEFAISRTYDVDNKVNQAVVPSGSARGIVGTHTYQYDALGRRVRKTVGGSTPSDTVFIHTEEQITADYAAGTAAASPTAKYLWGSYIDELVCQVSGAGGTTKLYPHRNQQYSTTALTDQTGAVVERYAYTPYGDIVAIDPTTLAARTTPPQTRYTYTGREYEQETGAYHFRARIYSATLGRFTGHDPILYPDGANAYAGWFAIAYNDATGEQSLQGKPSDFEVYKQKTVRTETPCPGCCSSEGKCTFSIELMRVCDLTAKPPTDKDGKITGIAVQDRYVLRLKSSPIRPTTLGELNPQGGACFGAFNRLNGPNDGFDFTLDNGTKCSLRQNNFPGNNPSPDEETMPQACRGKLGFRQGAGFGEYIFGPGVSSVHAHFSIGTECRCGSGQVDIPGNDTGPDGTDASDPAVNSISIDEKMNDDEIFKR